MFKLVRFSAEWCQPCKQLEKAMEQVSLPQDYKVVDIDKVDKLELQNLGIRGVPSLVLYKDDVEVARKVGYMPSEAVQTWLSKAGVYDET